VAVALTKDEWLHKAKALPIGGQRRVRHGNERRDNMTVGNEGDRWWAYCQACKVGGVEQKEHVRVTAQVAPKDSASLVLPHDMVHLLQAETAVRDGVLGFLATKNMDALYLPPLWFSPSRKRLLLQTQQGWLGRDTTERSMQKWLTFTAGTTLLGEHRGGVKETAVVVEDPFSFFKVRWALQDHPDIVVFSSLGTRVSDALSMMLLGYRKVLFFYDGDSAGMSGASSESHRFRAFGAKSFNVCAPLGKDPKDMTIDEIREHIASTP